MKMQKSKTVKVPSKSKEKMNLSGERASEESGDGDSLEDNESPNPVKNKMSSLFKKLTST